MEPQRENQFLPWIKILKRNRERNIIAKGAGYEKVDK